MVSARNVTVAPAGRGGLDLIANKRGDHNRLGAAVQIGTVRYLGHFLTENPLDVPWSAVEYVASQLEIADPDICLRFTARVTMLGSAVHAGRSRYSRDDRWKPDDKHGARAVGTVNGPSGDAVPGAAPLTVGCIRRASAGFRRSARARNQQAQ